MPSIFTRQFTRHENVCKRESGEGIDEFQQAEKKSKFYCETVNSSYNVNLLVSFISIDFSKQ